MSEEIKTTSVTTFQETESEKSVKFFDYTNQISKLTPDQKEKYLAMTQHLNPHDIATVQSYGSELSSVINKNGDNLLAAVRGNNTAEVVQLTTEILGQLNMIDMDELNSNKGFKNILRRIPILNKLVTSYENILIKYDSVKDNVLKISEKISTSKAIALRDNTTLQVIFDSTLAYINQVRDLIIAAKIKYEEVVREHTMMCQAPDQYESYVINDVAVFKDTLSKKIADMQTTEYILNQNLLQIRATQQNNYAIADKADNIVTNIIPIWKHQIAIGVTMNNQKAAVDAQKMITDTTNKILRENAKALKTNSIAVAAANEEAIVSLDTLKETTQLLVETIKEVKDIHDKGAQNRLDLEKHLSDFATAINDVMTQQKFGK